MKRQWIYRFKHRSAEEHAWGLLQGVAEIADGIVTLSSLGFYASGFEMAVAWKRAGCHIKALKKERARQENEQNSF